MIFIRPGLLTTSHHFWQTKYSSKEWGFSGIPQNLSFFGEKPQKSPKLNLSRPQNFPKIILGTFGDKTQKKTQFWTYSIPQKIPQNFSNLVPIPTPYSKEEGKFQRNKQWILRIFIFLVFFKVHERFFVWVDTLIIVIDFYNISLKNLSFHTQKSHFS